MANNSIMIDLDDPRSEKIADVISNKTAKRILALLAEKEMNGSEIANELKIPLNTTIYNIKKLVGAGLLDKSNKIFWSAKGKRIEFYKISNKRIIISPKLMVKGIIPAVIVSGALAIGIKIWADKQIGEGFVTDIGREAVSKAAETLPSSAIGTQRISEITLTIAQSAWLWFLVGALTALFIYLVWNLRRK